MVYLVPLISYATSSIGVTLICGKGNIVENGAYRSYTTLYRSAKIVTIYCIIFESFDVQNIVTLKTTLDVIEAHWKWRHDSICHI